MKQDNQQLIWDGNEAASYIAYKTSELCAIYPITPASPMGEFVDLWSAEGKKNIWDNVPKVIEMQSEGGAAGAVHGALQAGTLTSTFTASQGLLLMIPNMYKIAGELMPSVIHIAARSLATHALSIFGDHSDVMSTRSTGYAMLFSGSVQESMDLAMIAHSATLKGRIPFLHIFDGFRTSHEISKIEALSDEVISKMIDQQSVDRFRQRALSPDHPVIRGTAQNPDVFFQAREAINGYYEKLPELVQEAMMQLVELTGRQYGLYDYVGHPQAENIIIVMGSATETVEATVIHLLSCGERVGMVKVRLYRPFSAKHFVGVIPYTTQKIAVLDRTKEPGAIGEPLYQDVLNAFVEKRSNGQVPKIIGGRYGLSSKEFTPAMVAGIFEEMKKDQPLNHFTVGIKDDVTHTSLDYSLDFPLMESDFCGVFYGLGSDGTVSANKNSIKIIGETTDNYVQGYFVYDSKKAGAMTVSHLRFGKRKIRSPYLISKARFVACHQFNFLFKYDILEKAARGATFLLNAPYDKDEVWSQLPMEVQKTIIEKDLELYVIDATQVARETGMGKRTNTILQTCFFAISGILPVEESIDRIKNAIEKTYSSKGKSVVQKNFEAVDQALENLHHVDYPKVADSWKSRHAAVSDKAPQFVKEVLGEIMAGRGDELPVSAFPVDGTFPTSTTQWEKRNIADDVPVWDEGLCTQCNKCVLICPHAAIRAKIYDNSHLDEAPENFKSASPVGKEFDREKERYTLQVAVEDCTGCALCVEVCPVKSKTEEGHKAINMADIIPLREIERKNWEYFLQLPEINRSRVNKGSVKGSQLLQPLFEFSGACSGCGETPYLKLLTQLYGDSMVVANATGCSSIYGGNLPSTPWCVDRNGRGPAWANSLFEDNAEFGLGIRLSLDQRREKARILLRKLREEVGSQLADAILNADESNEDLKAEHQKNIDQLIINLRKINRREAREMEILAGDLRKRTVWIIGGDGWAYDIGYGGLDHVLATNENVNILVMDTEVYSNTGGQTSKATPLAASAKFSISGKLTPKKDLAFQAISYGNVYVAQVAMGANDTQTVRAINEANNYDGPSLIIAYAHCIEHGFDMAFGAEHQSQAVKSGHWPLYRYNPLNEKGKRFILDSKAPSISLKDYIYSESRYARLLNPNGHNGTSADKLLSMAEEGVKNKWQRLESIMHL